MTMRPIEDIAKEAGLLVAGKLVAIQRFAAIVRAEALEEMRERCAIAVFITLLQSQAEDADDLGLAGWLRQAEAAVRKVELKDAPHA